MSAQVINDLLEKAANEIERKQGAENGIGRMLRKAVSNGLVEKVLDVERAAGYSDGYSDGWRESETRLQTYRTQ